MKLDVLKTGYAVAIAFALVWLVCSLLVWGLPAMMSDVGGHMVHADFSGMGWHMSPVGFVIGLIAWSAIAGGIASLTVYIYNKLV